MSSFAYWEHGDVESKPTRQKHKNIEDTHREWNSLTQDVGSLHGSPIVLPSLPQMLRCCMYPVPGVRILNTHTYHECNSLTLDVWSLHGSPIVPPSLRQRLRCCMYPEAGVRILNTRTYHEYNSWTLDVWSLHGSPTDPPSLPRMLKCIGCSQYLWK